MSLGTVTYTVDNDIEIHNTSLKCKVKATYARLLELFGEPVQVKSDHSRVEWRVEFSDGEILCVYDWNESVPLEEVTVWHVAGHNFMAASRIYDILEGKPIMA